MSKRTAPLPVVKTREGEALWLKGIPVPDPKIIKCIITRDQNTQECEHTNPAVFPAQEPELEARAIVLYGGEPLVNTLLKRS